MSYAPKLAELRGLTDDELERRYDETTKNVVVGLEWYREEVNRRAMAAQTAEVIRETKVMTKLTVAVAVLTAANVGIAVALLIDAVR